MAQVYFSPISINAAQVPSTQTDFPVLVSQTDTRFKTVANGGHVNNSNGFDIRPYTDSSLTTELKFEMERYTATSGEVIMWVKVPSLSSSTTPIYLGYGDTGLNSDASSGPNTFSNNFVSVYHLKDGTTLSVADALGSFNGTNNGATAATGKIDGGCNVASASSQFIDLGSGLSVVGSGITISAWINGTTFPNAYNSVISKAAAGVNRWTIEVKSTGKLHFEVTGTGSVSYDGTGSNTLSAGTTYFLTLSYDSSAGLIGYVNASSDGTAAANGTLQNSTQAHRIGDNPAFAGTFFNGMIDEVRISTIARTANWITTEYNNQSAPGTFETLGAEQSFIPISGLYRL